MKSVHFPQFGGVSSEQNLIQDLIDEQIRLFGMDVYYIPKSMIIDRSFNDVILNVFTEAYLIEMMYISVEGFGGVSALGMTKFGLKITDEITLSVSKRRWKDFATLNESTFIKNRPNEGDLIYLPMTNNTYEIKYVEREVPFYQLGKNYVYGLSCELMETGGNRFDTDIPKIDNLNQETYVFPVYVKTGGIGVFEVGEKVIQTYTLPGDPPVTVEGTVAEWDQLNRKLNLTYIKGGALRENLPLVGQDTAASWVVDNFSTIDIDIDDYKNSENKFYEDKADDILDFTEGNPFGEYGNKTGSF